MAFGIGRPIAFSSRGFVQIKCGMLGDVLTMGSRSSAAAVVVVAKVGWAQGVQCGSVEDQSPGGAGTFSSSYCDGEKGKPACVDG
jgi:hypothetical protein